MMWRSFGGNLYSLRLELPYQLYCSSTRHVSYVQTAASELCQTTITKNHDVLGSAGDFPQTQTGGDHPFVHYPIAGKVTIFGMADNRQVKHLGVFQGPPHELAVHNRYAVVADRYNSRFFELSVLGQQFTFLALTDGSHRKDSHEVSFGCTAKDKVRNRGIIICRFGVGHATDRGETAGSCGLTSA